MNKSRIERHSRSNGPERCLQSILFFSAAHGTFFKIDHILGHKASPDKYKKTETTFCILSHQNAIKLEFNNKRNSRKYSRRG
jgi:hypothetical protein